MGFFRSHTHYETMEMQTSVILQFVAALLRYSNQKLNLHTARYFYRRYTQHTINVHIQTYIYFIITVFIFIYDSYV